MTRFEEPIRIISDLHLAHPGSSVVDVAQLSPVLEGVKTLIFNGDTIEERMKQYHDLAASHLEGARPAVDVRPALGQASRARPRAAAGSSRSQRSPVASSSGGGDRSGSRREERPDGG